jgi:hypothetical protein
LLPFLCVFDVTALAGEGAEPDDPRPQQVLCLLSAVCIETALLCADCLTVSLPAIYNLRPCNALLQHRYLLTHLHPLLGGSHGLTAPPCPNQNCLPALECRPPLTHLHQRSPFCCTFQPAILSDRFSNCNLVLNRRYLLTHLHPLLGGTVGMKGATVVEARLIPHDGLLPTSQATVRIEPLSVEIGESPVLRSTVGVLAEVVKKLKLSAGAKAELSPLQATLSSDGRLTAERLDVRIKTGESYMNNPQI